MPWVKMILDLARCSPKLSASGHTIKRHKMVTVDRLHADPRMRVSGNRVMQI
jgi:hypothetical protein